MVYFVSAHDVYEFPVYPEFLDAPSDGAFNGVTYEQDPETLDLRATERESLDKGHTAMAHGYRVNGDKAPKKMLWEGGDKALPDYIMRNQPAVSPRLRALIEQFEPGVHQFFPVDIWKKRNGEPVATYYWLNVCNRIDSVNEEKTTHERIRDYTGRFFWSSSRPENAKLVFSSEKIAPYHIWTDPDAPGLNYFHCSNAFAEAAQAAKFIGLALTQKEEA
jgi:hypothetical protein